MNNSNLPDKEKAPTTVSSGDLLGRYIVQSTAIMDDGTIKLRGWNRTYSAMGIIQAGTSLIQAGVRCLTEKESGRETQRIGQTDVHLHNPAKSSSAGNVKVQLEKLQNSDESFRGRPRGKNRK